MSNSAETTIAQLEDELKEAQRQIDELRRERNDRDMLIAEMREHIKARSALTEAWIEAFEMEQDLDGTWRWKSSFAEGDEWFAKYHVLLKQWNAAVADFNAKIASRPVGRPLAASEAQVAEVCKLRKQNRSLRNIAEETNLGLSTVRSIVYDEDRAMRAWRKRFEPIQLDALAEASWRSRSKLRAALPRRINESLKAGRELVQRAKGLK